MKLSFKTFIHCFDVYTDFLYLYTVPLYAVWVKWLISLSIYYPMYAILEQSLFLIPKAKILRITGRDGCLGRLIYAFGEVTMCLPLYHLLFVEKEETISPKKYKKILFEASSKYIVEDGPQFLIQMLNSIKVGTSWRWFQFVSPLLSLHGLTARFITPFHDFQDRLQKIGLLCFAQCLCIFPAFLVIVIEFAYADHRPEWAKVHTTIREHEYNVKAW